jgi:hypothetical protein
VELKATRRRGGRRRSWGERSRGEDCSEDSGNDEAPPIVDHDVRHVKSHVKWILCPQNVCVEF